MKRQSRRGRLGFTLIELIVVITIIGILAAAVVINAPSFIEKAKKKRAVADIVNIEKAVTAYRMEYGRYPESLEALVSPPSTGAGEEEPLLQRLPVDPWNNPYVYGVENRKPIILTFGPDGEQGTADDISNVSLLEADTEGR